MKLKIEKILFIVMIMVLLQGCMFGRNARHALLGPDYAYQRSTVVVVQQPHRH